MIGRKPRKSGWEAVRRRYGYTFVLPWVIGLILFFALPLVSSIWYAFCEVRVEPGAIVTEFVRLDNFRWLLFEDPDFFDQLASSLGYMFYSFPLIISFSLAIAILLNKRFFGRTLMRTLFFLPIVITASAVLPLLGGEDVRMPLFYGEDVLDAAQLVENLGIPSALRDFVTFLLNSVTEITYSSAVQIILLLGGLQNIPDSLYEASKIEGANKWEEFWMITIPSLRHVISLVMVYTMIDLFTSSSNWVVQRSYDFIMTQDYNKSSSMLWFYFAIVIAVIGAVYALYNRFCVRRWE